MSYDMAATSLADQAAAIAESGLFDAQYYLSQVDIDLRDEKDLIAHYIQYGWEANLNPSRRFSTAAYLEAHEDVRDARVNPLVHYVTFGSSEGRKIAPPHNREVSKIYVPLPRAPSDAEWADLEYGFAEKVSNYLSSDITDVIIPIYKGVEETLRCLYSVLSAKSESPFCVVAVDDHTPEPAIRERLQWLASRNMIHLKRTVRNCGFVQACNLGILEHPDRDVVLLNSDTEVYDYWLDRMRRAAYRHPMTATVTPFSNNAEICSYPHFIRNNWRGLEVSDAELDSLMAVVNANGEVEIPTGVGFCMYIRRDCLDVVGLLDYVNFGAGYGEENDLCRRAIAVGMRNVLAADVFVRHYGGTSFGASKRSRVEHAIATVERLHPGYLAEVFRFIAADPAYQWRRNVDLARFRRRFARNSRGTVMFVLHNRGGGTERHVQDMTCQLHESGVSVIFAQPSPSNDWKIQLSIPPLSEVPNLGTFDLANHPSEFADALALLDVGLIHVHHLAGFKEKFTDYLRLAADLAGVQYDVTLHDYMAYCPRITLVDENGFYCGEPDPTSCQACISSRGSDFGMPVVWEWRDRFERFLASARKIYVPSGDAASRIVRHFPKISVAVRPHTVPANFSQFLPELNRVETKVGGSSTCHIALLGALGPHKGSSLLLECALRARELGLPIRFSVVGYTDRDEELLSYENVSILGRYNDNDLLSIIADLRADAIWFPATWPETFSYTLTAALSSGVIPVAFDFGAIGERLRRAECGWLIPVEYMRDVDKILQELVSACMSDHPRTQVVEHVSYPDIISDYYELASLEPKPNRS
ncbi:glycosyl transferase family 2 [Methylobacterium nodulans ORS 2060]|uniref:Glycosyl transferase family 2 n=2 Tax=Methylobacterium nodulans TaxID=114616 RepID=B8IAQ5_METNO|nr:glycosyl transferase family 2 [Methylobacterium nodulans ORS 2060]